MRSSALRMPISTTIEAYKRAWGASLVELWHCAYGITQSAGRVVSWAGAIQGITLQAPTTARRPLYAPDGSFFGGRPVLQCTAAGLECLHTFGANGAGYQNGFTPIAPASFADAFSCVAVSRMRTSYAYPANPTGVPIRGVAGIVGDHYWTGYWAGLGSLSLCYGYNGNPDVDPPPASASGHVCKTRVLTSDRSNIAQWWPPIHTGMITLPEYKEIGLTVADAALSAGLERGDLTTGTPYTVSATGRAAKANGTGIGAWNTAGSTGAPWGIGNLTNVWIGNVQDEPDFTRGAQPTATAAMSLDQSLAMFAILRRPTYQAQYRSLRPWLADEFGVVINA